MPAATCSPGSARREPAGGAAAGEPAARNVNSNGNKLWAVAGGNTRYCVTGRIGTQRRRPSCPFSTQSAGRPSPNTSNKASTASVYSTEQTHALVKGPASGRFIRAAEWPNSRLTTGRSLRNLLIALATIVGVALTLIVTVALINTITQVLDEGQLLVHGIDPDEVRDQLIKWQVVSESSCLRSRRSVALSSALGCPPESAVGSSPIVASDKRQRRHEGYAVMTLLRVEFEAAINEIQRQITETDAAWRGRQAPPSGTTIA